MSITLRPIHHPSHASRSRSQTTVKPHVSVDFESYYDKEVSISALGGWGYLHHPKCIVYLVAIYDGKRLFVGDPRDYDWDSIQDRKWISHNRSHDKLVYEVTMDVVVSHEDWECTADMAVYLHCKRNLKDACKQLLGREVSKDVRKKMMGLLPAQMKELVLDGKKLRPKTKQDKRSFWDDVVKYAGEDAINGWELFDKHGHRWPEHERRLSRLTTHQAHCGLQIDQPRLLADLKALDKACQFAKRQLPWTTKDTDEGVLSIPELKRAIKALGLDPPLTTSEDSESCKRWEASHPGCRLIQFMRDFRKCNIQRRRFEHIRDRLMPNGRFPFAWLYGGADHTLRWSGGSSRRRGGTGETGFNVQNMQKELIKLKATGEVIHDKKH